VQLVEKTVQTKQGPQTLHIPRMTPDDLAGVMFDREPAALCIGCGAEADTEPDARRARCPMCDRRLVYGLEEFALMGLVELVEPEEVKS
jgi:hypothetical protein